MGAAYLKKGGPKVAHVLAAPDPGGHICHWPGCTRSVKPAFWGCREHWYMLPPLIRAKIWATYRPGQEVSKTPSPAYLEAARAAEQWIAEQGEPRQGTMPL